MVMHPHLEHLPTHPNTSAEPLYLIIQILPLQFPPQLLRKPQHLLLLLCRELRPETLLPRPTPLRRLQHPARRRPLLPPAVVHEVRRQLRRLPPAPAAGVAHPSGWRGARDFAVEVAVAPAGGALEADTGGGVVEGELAAAVGGVAAEAGCMVSQTLSVDRV